MKTPRQPHSRNNLLDGEEGKEKRKTTPNSVGPERVAPVHSQCIVSRSTSHVLSEEPSGTISPSLEKRQTSAKKFETSSIDAEPCQSLGQADFRLNYYPGSFLDSFWFLSSQSSHDFPKAVSSPEKWMETISSYPTSLVPS